MLTPQEKAECVFWFTKQNLTIIRQEIAQQTMQDKLQHVSQFATGTSS